MPCVFPVLAMKALSLAGQGGTSSYERIVQGLAYTLGVLLLFFAAVAALLLGLRLAGANLGWGFQLQYPPFVALMAYLFLVLGLSLAGAVTIGSGLMGVAAAGPAAGAAGTFVTGGLAAQVAAPCTAPFKGAALGYAVTLAWPAAWCITCLVNERVALSTAGVQALFDEYRVLYLKGDWTNRDPAITDYLSGFGRNGVPLHVYYPQDGGPRILPQILTESTVREALQHKEITR